ncbi:MAG: GxxExxY protein [Planctomycetaceae bacterium]|nr:GxxExxY protein [Planctomycetaceae bacterium]
MSSPLLLVEVSLREFSRVVIGAAIEVRRLLGSGTLESIYETCLVHELEVRGIAYLKQQAMTVRDQGISFNEELRCDLFVAGVS